MRFSEYVGSKMTTLCFLGIGAILLAIVFLLGGPGWGMAVSAEACFLFLVICWLLTDWYRSRRRLKQLQAILEGLPERYLMGEVISNPQNFLEKQYYEIMKEVSRSAVGIAEDSMREKEEYCAYVEQWIHEMKTPLTACSLILDNGGDVKKIRRELKRADNLTETILYYARLKTAEKDIHIQEISAADVFDEAVKSQMELLIAAGIRIEKEGDMLVSTDGKILGFMLRQLLINCAKYCPGCCIRFQAKDGVLSLEDNGPGIPSHEIARVTERGFTGTSGKKKGTGMGLYLVREFCRTIGISLHIDSEEGIYTRFQFTFPSGKCKE